MKLDKIQPDHIGLKTEVSKKQQKEITLLGVSRKIRGLRLYEYEIGTGQICEAEYIQNDTFTIGHEGQNKVHVKQGCIYAQAMNKENALKKIRKLLK